MLTVFEKMSLLSSPTWSYQEIMKYFEVCKSTALKIKKRAIKEKNGGIKYGSNLVKTDSVLSLYGTSREHEILILNKINEEKK
jgi:hypothetical protein